MSLPRRSQGYLEIMAGLGSIKEVTIIHPSEDGPESRTTARALIQATHAYFELPTAVYEGDFLEYPDPRGGNERKFAAEVKVNEMGAAPELEHIAVKFGKAPAPAPSQPSVVYNAPVINVHGDRAQLAWDNDSVVQNQASNKDIAPGYEELAALVVSIVERLPELELTTEDQEIAQESADEILAEVTKESPARKLIVRASRAINGVLAPIALAAVNGAATSVQGFATEAVKQLSKLVFPQ